jgi:hypothetical protein
MLRDVTSECGDSWEFPNLPSRKVAKRVFAIWEEYSRLYRVFDRCDIVRPFRPWRAAVVSTDPQSAVTTVTWERKVTAHIVAALPVLERELSWGGWRVFNVLFGYQDKVWVLMSKGNRGPVSTSVRFGRSFEESRVVVGLSDLDVAFLISGWFNGRV